MSLLYRNKAPLILASSSPRRKELLGAVGVQFEVMPSGVDEESIQLAPSELVRELALLKAKDVATKYKDAWVLGGDTMVVLDGVVIGKPGNDRDAKRILAALSGREHEVVGGIALVREQTQESLTRVSTTRVRFGHLTPEVIDAYVRTGEGRDKAGSYALQGIGGSFVEAVYGSFSNVIGLDLPVVCSLLLEKEVIEVDHK